MSAPIQDLQFILEVAKKVRSRVIRWIKNNPDINHQDLTGACAIASHALWRALLSLGYDKANLVCVSTIDYGHCWVEYQGYVVDITATQFAGPEIAVFKRREAPYWFSNVTWGRRRLNDHAVKEVSQWGLQSPLQYETQTSRLVKKLERETIF